MWSDEGSDEGSKEKRAHGHAKALKMAWSTCEEKGGKRASESQGTMSDGVRV